MSRNRAVLFGQVADCAQMIDQWPQVTGRVAQRFRQIFLGEKLIHGLAVQVSLRHGNGLSPTAIRVHEVQHDVAAIGGRETIVDIVEHVPLNDGVGHVERRGRVDLPTDPPIEHIGKRKGDAYIFRG